MLVYVVFAQHSVPILAHIVVMFCFILYVLFCVTGRVEARLSMGFSPQLAEVFFPGTLCGPTSV